MRAGDLLCDVWLNVRRQKVRSALTCAGVGVGTFAIVLMVSLGNGLQTFLETQLRAFSDPRAVHVMTLPPDVVERGLSVIGNLGRPARPIREEDEQFLDRMRSPTGLSEEDRARLLALPGVVAMEPGIFLRVDSIRLASETTRYEVNAMPRSWREPLEIAFGRGFTEESDAEVVLSYQYAEAFGVAPADLVGSQVELRVPNLVGLTYLFLRSAGPWQAEWRVFTATVVGLTPKTIVSTVAYLPKPFAIRLARYQRQDETAFEGDRFGFYAILRLADESYVEPVKLAVKDMGWSARSVDDDLGVLRRLFLIIETFLSLFGLIALVVAALGIVNTLLMAIYERTREIGVMKALGATSGTIRILFACEAGAIGLAGGAAGILLAVVSGFAGNEIARRTFAADWGDYAMFVFPPWLILFALAFATLVGTLAGLYPAARAARLDPIAALAYE